MEIKIQGKNIKEAFWYHGEIGQVFSVVFPCKKGYMVKRKGIEGLWLVKKAHAFLIDDDIV